MNGAQLLKAYGDSSGLMTGPPAEGWSTRLTSRGPGPPADPVSNVFH